jgi:NitT/TauT family transport system substrate-binding protein
MRPETAAVPVTCHRRPTRPSRIVYAAIGALALVASAAGCQAGGPGSDSSGTGTSTFTVAATPGVDDAPLYLALKNGLFAKAGLNVRIYSYPSVSKEMQALANGSVDVAAGDYVDFFYAAATAKWSRLNLRVAADGYHAASGVMEVLALPNSGITTPQDLENKTIGTTEPQLISMQPNSDVPYSLETVATDSVLDNDGVPLNSVRWKPLPAGDLINALFDHQVNAILIQEPYIYEAESQLGAVEVLDSCSGATASLPLSGYFATGSFASKNPDAVADFRSALQRAQADAALPGPVESVLAHDSGMNMNMQTASLVTIGDYPTSLNAASLQRVADLMFSFDVLRQTLNVAGMVGP